MPKSPLASRASKTVERDCRRPKLQRTLERLSTESVSM
ncbi:hypothetical protein HSB1_37900 [Halogranum salarium B-1]|uniref:Uncharacterized protein n=1 Tax=Halogranum salarium B-1 TaxID=1210908 RepID=J2ZZB1_9EURY|nr:hypothetical protein HSB1_37900 [Halogranum salarium B-1]